MFRTLRLCALVALLLVSSFSIANEPVAAPTPEAGKALVVFLRPAWRGSAFGASIYEAPDDRTQIIGFI